MRTISGFHATRLYFGTSSSSGFPGANDNRSQETIRPVQQRSSSTPITTHSNSSRETIKPVTKQSSLPIASPTSIQLQSTDASTEPLTLRQQLDSNMEYMWPPGKALVPETTEAESAFLSLYKDEYEPRRKSLDEQLQTLDEARQQWRKLKPKNDRYNLNYASAEEQAEEEAEALRLHQEKAGAVVGTTVGNVVGSVMHFVDKVLYQHPRSVAHQNYLNAMGDVEDTEVYLENLDAQKAILDQRHQSASPTPSSPPPKKRKRLPAREHQLDAMG